MWPLPRAEVLQAKHLGATAAAPPLESLSSAQLGCSPADPSRSVWFCADPERTRGDCPVPNLVVQAGQPRALPPRTGACRVDGYERAVAVLDLEPDRMGPSGGDIFVSMRQPTDLDASLTNRGLAAGRVL